MSYLKTFFDIFKIVFAFAFTLAAVSFWINGLTGWREKGQRKKLLTVSAWVVLGLFAGMYLLAKW